MNKQKIMWLSATDDFFTPLESPSQHLATVGATLENSPDFCSHNLELLLEVVVEHRVEDGIGDGGGHANQVAEQVGEHHVSFK